MPPIYWSTGIQCPIFVLSRGYSSLREQYLTKYHEESTNVSIVSVSRRAGLPHAGQAALMKDSVSARGEPPVPVSLMSSGRITGRSFSGTGTIPHFSQ